MNVHFTRALASRVHTIVIKPIAARESSLHFAVYRIFGVWCVWRLSSAGASEAMCLKSTSQVDLNLKGAGRKDRAD